MSQNDTISSLIQNVCHGSLCEKMAGESDLGPVKAALVAVRGNRIANIQAVTYKVYLTIQDYKKMFSSCSRDCFCMYFTSISVHLLPEYWICSVEAELSKALDEGLKK